MTNAPTVALFALTYVPGAIGGAETYLKALSALHCRAGEPEVTVLLPDLSNFQGDLPTGRQLSALCAARSTQRRLANLARGAVRSRAILREVGFPELSGVHYPLTTRIPRVQSIPTASTILDVQHLIFPERFSRQERLYRRLVFGNAARSDLIITISHHAADTLVSHLGIDRGRIRPIHLGVDSAVFRHDPTIEREDFLLYPAHAWPHKNHVRLLEAFALVRRRHPGIRLVLTGGGDTRHLHGPGVTHLGRVDDATMVRLYQSARALVFPSLYEGFGLPPLEAMAAGCPVAVGAVGSIPEVCGDAVVYFEPTDIRSIVDGVETVLEQDEDLRERGLQRSREFTWDRTRERHMAVYEELVLTAPRTR